jgi:hypothetical protein
VASTRARRSVDRDVDERPEPRSRPADAPTRHDVLLRLQQAAGNQAVQRLLAPRARVVQRLGDPEFTHLGSGVVVETISTQAALDEAVESVIEEDLDGHRALFTKNGIATSVGEWRDLVLGLLRDHYTLDGLGAPDVLKSIRTIKDKYRDESLKHFAQVWVYWNLQDDVPPWSADELKRRMVAAGAYLEGADDEVIEALYDTGGAFAQTKVQFDAAKNIELLDEDNVVVLIDHHQQKHQMDKIPEFPAYSGEPGSKFAAGKGLQWHRDNTAQVVKTTVEQAVAGKLATPTKDYTPPKVPKDGIVYDLIIRYDEPTGKFVGSYHCNPLVNE